MIPAFQKPSRHERFVLSSTVNSNSGQFIKSKVQSSHGKDLANNSLKVARILIQVIFLITRAEVSDRKRKAFLHMLLPRDLLHSKSNSLLNNLYKKTSYSLQRHHKTGDWHHHLCNPSRHFMTIPLDLT